MKTFKKVAAMLLGLTMSVSLFACGGDNGDSSSAGGGGFLPEGNLQEGDGAKYLEGALDAFKEANTITIDFSLNANVSGIPNATGTNPSAAQQASIEATYVLAKTDNGYNMSFEGVMKSTEDGEVYEDPAKFYIVDGWLYEYDRYEEVWEKENIADAMDEEGFAAISEIYNMLLSEDADFSEVYEILGPVLEEFLYIENNEYKFALDMKDEVNAAIDYIANLDYNQTVEAYLNSVLADLGSDKTVKGILDEVATYGAYTVGEAYADLNEILVQETGKNVNGLKADLVAELEAIDTSLFEEYLSAEEIQQFNAIVAQIKGMDIDALVKPYEAITVDQIVTMLVGSQQDGPAPYSEETLTLKAMTDLVYQMVSSTTLEQALYSMGMKDLMDISEDCAYLTISDLSENLSVKFNGFKFSSLEYSAKVGGSYVTDEENISASANYSCKASFSKEKTTISAPENAVQNG